MADWETISSLATGGGTLVLAIATFASVRSANAAARVAERGLLASQRPILIPSRTDDPEEVVGFGDGKELRVKGHGSATKIYDDNIYLAMALRNGGAGVAVIDAWRVQAEETPSTDKPDINSFRRQSRDLYIPADTSGFWQGAIRDSSDPSYGSVKTAIDQGERLTIDLLYGDHEGGQRAIVRFRTGFDRENYTHGGRVGVIRYWNIDREDPR
jgi:hypothetical protein